VVFKPNGSMFVFPGLLCMMGACDPGTGPSSGVAVLTTIEVTGITSTSALSGGSITSDGGKSVSARGVCWSTRPTPTIQDNITADGVGSGGFASAMTGLSAGTTYQVRAYATNGTGTGYGGTRSFTTADSGFLVPYLGQTPPGREFVRFAPSIVPEDMYHSVTVSPDGREIYWADIQHGLTVTRFEDGHWTAPEVLPFSVVTGMQPWLSWDDAPVVSPDNRKLFFNSLRACGSGPGGERWNFWVSERTGSGWSEPVPLPDVINSATGGIHWQISVSGLGTLAFGKTIQDTEGAPFSILCSRLVDGVYTTPEPVDVVNNFSLAVCPFIAPDESYLIFNRIGRAPDDQHYMSVGYYICFKGGDGQWLAPQALPGFPENESSFVTRDGHYVFCKAYWASTEIIEDLRPR
jgi:hypothetical protein